ncbi:MAG: MarR family winged helix-turn-helix transcriptional regulator [Anaerolineaceae bacterium]
MNRSHRHLSEEEKEKYITMRQHFEQRIKELAGDKAVQGFELSGLIRRIGNLYDAIVNLDYGKSELSGPRLAILMHLYINSDFEKSEGITPTNLSHFQNVGKNTISSLIYGLENQGFLIRENDPIDRRIYRLKITDAGRAVVKQLVPQQMEYMDNMSSELSNEEKDQLIILLRKLLHSLQTNSVLMRNQKQKEL